MIGSEWLDFFDFISQIIIFVCGPAAIFLVGRGSKWGFILGLLGQPGYIFTSFMNKQWGIFFVSFIYTIIWLKGLYNWYYKPEQVVARLVKS